MRLLYFAWLRGKIGKGEEALAPPAEVVTVGDLIVWLRTLSPAHAAALAEPARLRVAVNQEYATFETAVKTGDEIALFPPVTGG